MSCLELGGQARGGRDVLTKTHWIRTLQNRCQFSPNVLWISAGLKSFKSSKTLSSQSLRTLEFRVGKKFWLSENYGIKKIAVANTADNPCQENNILKRGRATTKFIKKVGVAGSPADTAATLPMEGPGPAIPTSSDTSRPLSHLDHRSIKHTNTRNIIIHIMSYA